VISFGQRHHHALQLGHVLSRLCNIMDTAKLRVEQSTHRVRTDAVLLFNALRLTLTCDSETPKPYYFYFSRISQGHSLHQVKVWTLWTHSFSSYAPDISVKNALTDPVSFQPKNHVISSISQGHSLYQLLTLWDHSFLSYAPDKQTNRRTASNVLPTPIDTVGIGVGNSINVRAPSNKIPVTPLV